MQQHWKQTTALLVPSPVGAPGRLFYWRAAHAIRSLRVLRPASGACPTSQPAGPAQDGGARQTWAKGCGRHRPPLYAARPSVCGSLM